MYPNETLKVPKTFWVVFTNINNIIKLSITTTDSKTLHASLCMGSSMWYHNGLYFGSIGSLRKNTTPGQNSSCRRMTKCPFVTQKSKQTSTEIVMGESWEKVNPWDSVVPRMLMVLTSNYKQHERKKAIITSKTATFSMLKKHFTPATNCLAREGAAFAQKP